MTSLLEGLPPSDPSLSNAVSESLSDLSWKIKRYSHAGAPATEEPWVP